MTDFPTGKPHISYSEVKTWTECGWRHKLTYIDKVDLPFDSPHADFGTAVHAGVESYLKIRQMDTEKVHVSLESVLKEKGREDVEKWKGWATVVLTDMPTFLDTEFPGWELLGAELNLYEDIPNETVKFKGFVDCVLRVPLGNDKWKVWIIDWKTGPAYGWRAEKRQDPLTVAQLYLYKDYLLRKLGLESRNVGVAFAVLKKGAKPGKSIDRIDVSAGPAALEKGSKLVMNMVNGVRRGKFLKNKYACEWCDYAKSGHCTR